MPERKEKALPKHIQAGQAVLARHAGKKDTIEFAETVLHGKMAFRQGEVVRFEDPSVAAYFDIAFNGTEFSTKEPTRTVGEDEINFDPEDPRQNETIDPLTRITGRAGIESGTTVHQHLSGGVGSGGKALEPHDADSGSEA